MRFEGNASAEYGSESSATALRCVFATTLDLSRQGGPSDHFGGIVRGLATGGFRITVLSPAPSGPIRDAFPANVSFVHYPSLRLLGLPDAFSGIFALPKLWKLREFRAAYVRSSPGTLPVTLFARIAGFQSVVVEHNGWLRDEITSFGYWWGWSKLAGWLQIREAKLATANRVVSERLVNLLAGQGVAKRKLYEIGNGADTDVFCPLDREDCRRRLGLTDTEKPLLAYVGNLWPGAGVENIFHAMNLIKADGIDADLIVAGDGIAESSLKSAAQRILGQGNRVRFVGYLAPSDANIVLGAADVGMAPYLVERNVTVGVSPLKLLSYAAAGRPCVVSSLPGTQELATEPWIFLAEAGSAQSLAAAIKRALSSNRHETSQSARAYAINNDWRVVAGRISNLLFGRGGDVAMHGTVRLGSD